MPKPAKPDSVAVPAPRARTNFGRLLQRVEDERRSVVIEKRGTPSAVLMSIRDYVRLAAPEPEVLRILGEESEAQGTDRLSGQEIEKIIRRARPKQPTRPKRPKERGRRAN
jgi:prevent-host-death family protein